MVESKQQLAGLLNVSANDILLEVIEAGLTHSSYCCHVSDRKYYIKKYNNIENIYKVVSYINELTCYMRERGIPASRVYAYSPDLANIVIHEYVEGAMHAGEFSQLPAIADLCSKIILVGADHGRHLSKVEYLAGIHATADQIRALENQRAVVDPTVQSGMLAVIDAVLVSLEANMTDAKLFHVHVHDDFTEKNILLAEDRVKLLCDWDSCRLKFINEYLACSATRFSTERPLDGLLSRRKLRHFMLSLDPRVAGLITDVEEFASLFALWATLKHLRTYAFRNSRVRADRPDLKASLLTWPLQHCQWLLANRHQVGEWVSELLE